MLSYILISLINCLVPHTSSSLPLSRSLYSSMNCASIYTCAQHMRLLHTMDITVPVVGATRYNVQGGGETVNTHCCWGHACAIHWVVRKGGSWEDLISCRAVDPSIALLQVQVHYKTK